MDSDSRGSYHQYLPIAIDQQEGQTAKDMKVHLDHPTRLMDDQGRIDHEEDAHDDTCEARSRCHYGQAEANGRGEPSNHEGAAPGPVDEGQSQGKHEMYQEEPTQETISVPPSGVEESDPGVGSRGYQCVVISSSIAHTVESFPEVAMSASGSGYLRGSREWPLRSLPVPGALPCCSQRMTTHAPGRALHRASPSVYDRLAQSFLHSQARTQMQTSLSPRLQSHLVRPPYLNAMLLCRSGKTPGASAEDRQLERPPAEMAPSTVPVTVT